MIGQYVRKSAVIRTLGSDNRGRKQWIILCSVCGKERNINETNLKTGDRLNCRGCYLLNPLTKKRRPLPDLVGKRFGKITIIKCEFIIKKSGKRRKQYTSKCDCGRIGKSDGRQYLREYNPATMCSPCTHRENPKGKDINFKSVLGTYKAGAKERGFAFELTTDDCVQLFKGNCFYCGSPPSNVRRCKRSPHRAAFIHSGIDRVDNDFGYTSENTVSCCPQCNYAKRDLAQEEFFLKIKQIYEYNKLGAKND